MSDNPDGLHHEELLPEQELKMLNPVTLAFLGDAVFGLMVREHLIGMGITHASKLHHLAVTYVSAGAQAAAAEKLLSYLTPEEQDIFRRGRNANTVHPPRKADPLDYRHATGLEALFGYLYLKGDIARLNSLFEQILRGREPGKL